MICRIVLRLSLIGAAMCVAGCIEIRGREPELSRSERRIMERRKLHGEETTFTRRDWRYESKDDRWRWEPRRKRPEPNVDFSRPSTPHHSILPLPDNALPPVD